MAPRKKQYGTRGEQQRAYEERLQQSGKRRVCTWLHEGTIDKLGRLVEARGTDRAALLTDLIEKAKK